MYKNYRGEPFKRELAEAMKRCAELAEIEKEPKYEGMAPMLAKIIFQGSTTKYICPNDNVVEISCNHNPLPLPINQSAFWSRPKAKQFLKLHKGYQDAFMCFLRWLTEGIRTMGALDQSFCCKTYAVLCDAWEEAEAEDKLNKSIVVRNLQP